MSAMTDSRALEVLAEVRKDGGTVAEADYTAAIDHAIARLREPAGVGVFDAAVSAELPRVSHIEYDSHEICKHFAAKVRERIAAPQPPAEAQAQAISPEWSACRKRPVVVHVREQRAGEQHVSTREGITPVKPDDLIMRGVEGEEYPIGRDLFNKTYDLVDETQAQGGGEVKYQVQDRATGFWIDSHRTGYELTLQRGGVARVVYTAPQSAPVGAEAIAAEIRASLGRGATVSARRRWAVELEALAQPQGGA